jgi:glutathione peroxidase
MTLRQKFLKWFYPFVMKGSRGTNKDLVLQKPEKSATSDGFYKLSVQQNSGNIIDFSELKGKKVLLVNTASNCGFTGQFTELQELHNKYKNQLVIIGFPANDFKEQEKGSDDAISEFCQVNYGVTFPLAKKASVVKGNQQQEVFQWLSNEKQNGWCNQDPVWNFSKYLIDENGELTGFYGPAVLPSSIPL